MPVLPCHAAFAAAVHAACAHLGVPVSAPCPRPGACDGVSAGVAWARMSVRCHVRSSDQHSISMRVTRRVRPGVLGHMWLRDDEWCSGVPTRVQCCIAPQRSGGLYNPGLASSRPPAAVELVPGTAKVNSAEARRHGAGKL